MSIRKHSRPPSCNYPPYPLLSKLSTKSTFSSQTMSRKWLSFTTNMKMRKIFVMMKHKKFMKMEKSPSSGWNQDWPNPPNLSGRTISKSSHKSISKKWLKSINRWRKLDRRMLFKTKPMIKVRKVFQGEKGTTEYIVFLCFLEESVKRIFLFCRKISGWLSYTLWYF